MKMKIKNLAMAGLIVTGVLLLVRETVEIISEIQIIEPTNNNYDLEEKGLIIIDIEDYEEFKEDKISNKISFGGRILNKFRNQQILF